MEPLQNSLARATAEGQRVEGTSQGHLLTLASLPPTAQLVTTRDSLVGRMDRWRQAIAALDEETCPLSPSSRALAKAQQLQALRQHEGQLTALNDQLALAAERDGLAAERPPGCGCLGLGGRGRLLRDHAAALGPVVPLPGGGAAARGERRVRGRAGGGAPRGGRPSRRAGGPIADYRARQGRANLPPRYREATFETFPPEVSKEAVVQALDALAGSRDETRGVYLWGAFGVGKTGLACAALNRRIEQQWPGLFVTVSAFLDWVRRTYDRQSEETTDDVMQRVSTSPFLVFDDLGAEYLTRWGRDRLFAVINHRDTHNLLTLITSNYAPDEIAIRLAGDDDLREGKRIVWRILECCDVIELVGRNLRARESADGD
jgi:DNA replication protein DnaC